MGKAIHVAKLSFKSIGLVAVMMFGVAGCSSKATEKVEIVANKVVEDEDVALVKNGHLADETNITVGEAFENFFGSPGWRSFTGENEEKVVEFTGKCTYAEVEVTATIQFVIEGDTFKLQAVSFNDVPQNMLTSAALLAKVYEQEETEEPVQSEDESHPETTEATNQLQIEATETESSDGYVEGGGVKADSYYEEYTGEETLDPSEEYETVIDAYGNEVIDWNGDGEWSEEDVEICLQQPVDNCYPEGTNAE